jgi:hypothetical protein
VVPERRDVKDFSGINITPQDWFLLSRIDGRTNVHALGQLTGQGDADVAAALLRLQSAGLITLPTNQQVRSSNNTMRVVSAPTPAGSPPRDASPRQAESARRPTPAPAAPARDSTPRSSAVDAAASRRPATTTPPKVAPPVAPGEDEESGDDDFKEPSSISARLIPANWPTRFENFMFDPADLATGPVLSVNQKQVVLYYHHHLRRVSYYDLFQVNPRASRKEIKLAYFALSKAFHPDRWFRKDTGDFGTLIEDVFKWLNRAYTVLSSPRKRAGYDELLRRGYIGEWQLEEQKRTEGKVPKPAPTKAAEQPESRKAWEMLLVRARRAEASEDWPEAVDAYERALQLGAGLEVRARMVECLLRWGKDLPRVRDELELLTGRGADEKLVMYLEGELASLEGDVSRAAARYQRVLDLDPSHLGAQRGVERLGERR